MYKILRSDKDTYITDKAVKKTRKLESNVGAAGTLDLFKVYGSLYSGTMPLAETSRLLIHFDLSPLRSLVEAGLIDTNDDSFWCEMRLNDVYGGQTTPSDFTISVFPLSASFEEGTGRDSSYYSDSGLCNWVSSSRGNSWHVTGCSAQGNAVSPCDYITSSVSMPVTEVRQYFKEGTEDLRVDVTAIVSATLSNEIPDSGFRITFENSIEEDTSTYFVKRFASRTAYDESKRPSLAFGYDDSIVDDTQNLSIDAPGSISLYNYVSGRLSNLTSGALNTPVSGSDCLLLRLNSSAGNVSKDFYFTGSQHTRCYNSGVYSAEIFLNSSDAFIAGILANSSSIAFTPYWTSLDQTVSFSTGSVLVVRKPDRRSYRSTPSFFTVSVIGLDDEYDDSSTVTARVHVFDGNSPLIKLYKIPVELPGLVITESYYQIRDSVTGEIVIPFEVDHRSTSISCDSSGMFFKFDTDALPAGRTYTIDIMTIHDGITTKHLDASPVFRIARRA